MGKIIAALLFSSLAFSQYTPPAGGGGGGGSPTGAAGGVLSGTYPNPGFATSPHFTGKLGVNASAALATITSQPQTATTISSCTTTANNASTVNGVGAGCLFDSQSQIAAGDRIELSGTPGTLCPVIRVVSDTQVLLETEFWGDVCGDGTSQTITVYHASFQLRSDDGVSALVMDNAGKIAIGRNTFWGDPLSGAVTVPDSFIFFNQGLDSASHKAVAIDCGTLSADSHNYSAGEYPVCLNNAIYLKGTGTTAFAMATYEYAFVRPGAGVVTDLSTYTGSIDNQSSNPVTDAAVFNARDFGGAGGYTKASGFRSQISAGAGRWAFYGVGTAASHFGGVVDAPLWATTTNCADSAGAAACGSASAGAVVIDAAATTVVVSTTAVTANSEILASFDSSLGTRLGVTCNTTIALPAITARTAGTSFTIAVAVAPITNPACFNYTIMN